MFTNIVLMFIPILMAGTADVQRLPTIKNVTNVKMLLEKIQQKETVQELRDFVQSGKPSRFVGSSGHKAALEYLEKRIKKLDANPSQSSLVIEKFLPDVEQAKKMYQEDFKREILGKYPPSDPTYKKWDRFTKSMLNWMDKFKNIEGQNIIWEKKGTVRPDDVLIISAHYDTISHDKETLEIRPHDEMPGADDNGSGVTIALQLIAQLSALDLPKTVRVVFFDYEELGFLGSKNYLDLHAAELKKKNFLGLVNLEMLGHDSRSGHLKKTDKKGKPIAVKTGDMRIYIRAPLEAQHHDDLQLANRLQNYGKKIAPSVQFEIVPNGFNSSDHLYFWQSGLPAITFSQNWEDDFNQQRYHSPNDFVETLNLQTFHYAFRYVAGAVLALLFEL